MGERTDVLHELMVSPAEYEGAAGQDGGVGTTPEAQRDLFSAHRARTPWRVSEGGLKYYDTTMPVLDPPVPGEGEVVPLRQGAARGASPAADTVATGGAAIDASYDPSSLPTYFAGDDLSLSAVSHGAGAAHPDGDETFSMATSGASPARLRYCDPWAQPPAATRPPVIDYLSDMDDEEAAADTEPAPTPRAGDGAEAGAPPSPPPGLEDGDDEGGAEEAVPPPKLPETLWLVLRRRVERAGPTGRVKAYAELKTHAPANDGGAGAAAPAPTTTVKREVHRLKILPDFVNGEPAWGKGADGVGPRVEAQDGKWVVLDGNGDAVQETAPGVAAEGWLPHQGEVAWAGVTSGDGEGLGVVGAEVHVDVPAFENPQRPVDVPLRLCSHKRDSALPAVAAARGERRQLAMQREALHQQLARDKAAAGKLQADLRHVVQEPPVQRGVNVAARDAYHKEVLSGGAPPVTQPTAAVENPAAGGRPWEHCPSFVPAADQPDVRRLMSLASGQTRGYAARLPERVGEKQRVFERDYVKRQAASRELPPRIAPIPTGDRGINQQIAHLRAQCYSGGQPRSFPLVAPQRPRPGQGVDVAHYQETPARGPAVSGTPHTGAPAAWSTATKGTGASSSSRSLGSRWLQTPAAADVGGHARFAPKDLGSVARQL